MRRRAKRRKNGERRQSRKIRLPKLKDALFLPPNLLTFLRILFVPIIVFMLAFNDKSLYPYAAWIFIVAAVTDFFDGYLARKMKITSTVGKVLDPLADKLMVISILIMFVAIGRVEAWLVVLITAREVVITALRTLASSAGIIIAADSLGKFKTVFQIVAIPALLFDNTLFYVHSHKIGHFSLIISVCFSIVSAYFYMRNFFKQAKDLEF